MEVSKVSTAVSHVIIGGQDSIQMGITDNAEFFQMLSSALYRNPKLAMIRETMCNCWDAHVMNGTDRPIEITLTNDKLIFRDFGPGIHHDQIGPIYGVYGNSTKRNQANQTGGFGLGCKSPFAYQNHFQVVSFHEGVKTIYRMAKSNGEVKGKPSITPIVSIPTTETGLEVTIDIKDVADRNQFEQYINQVSVNAGKTVKLNGHLNGAVINYSLAEGSYVITEHASGYGAGESILIKVGDVVYPVANEATYSVVFFEAINFMRKIGTHLKLILLAEPGTIAITPSREAITADTNDVVKKLLEDFMEDTKTKVRSFYPEFLKKCQNHFINLSLLGSEMREKTMGWVDTMPTSPKDSLGMSMHQRALSSPRDISMYIFCEDRKYPDGFKSDIAERIERLAKTVPDHMRNALPRYTKMLRCNPALNSNTKLNALQRIFLPHLLKACPGIKLEDVSVRLTKRSCHTHTWYTDDSILVRPHKIGGQTVVSLSPLLNGYVVLYRSEKNLVSRIRNHWKGVLKYETKYALLDPESFFCIKAPSKVKDLEEYRRILKESGYHVIDAVSKFEWEKKPKQTVEVNGVVVEKKATPKRKGLPVASGLIRPGHGWINTHRTKYGEPRAFEGTPDFYIMVSYRGNDGEVSITGLSPDNSLKFLKLFGERGVVISTETQRAKMLKDGVPDHIKFLGKTLDEAVKNDWKLRRKLAYRTEHTFHTKFKFRDSGYNEFEALCKSRTAKNFLGFKDQPANEAHELFESLLMDARNSYSSITISAETVKLINRIEENPARQVNNMAEIARKSELLQVIKIGQLDQLIANGNRFAGEILKNALKR